MGKKILMKSGIKPNTFIGGVGATINTPALLATKLGIAVSRIKGFRVVGLDVQCAIIGSYSIPASAFYLNNKITYFDDIEGLVTTIHYGVFSGASNLTLVNFPNCLTVNGGNYGAAGAFFNCIELVSVNLPKFSYSTDTRYLFSNCKKIEILNFPLYEGFLDNFMFQGCLELWEVNTKKVTVVGNATFQNTKIKSLDFTYVTSIGISAFENCTHFNIDIIAPECTSIGNRAFLGSKITGLTASKCKNISYSTFANCSEATYYSFPKLLNIDDGGSITNTFSNNSKVTSIFMPIVTSLGNNTALNNVFLNIKTGCTIKVPVAMQTINAGGVEPDLQYAISTRGANVIYI